MESNTRSKFLLPHVVFRKTGTHFFATCSNFAPRRPLRLSAGALLALAVAGLIVALFAAIVAAAPTAAATHLPRDLGALLVMTATQAALSTLCALVLGTALAWALNRQRFLGREWVVGLLSAAMAAPGMVVAFGLLAVWGRSGWFGWLGLPVFGMGAVVAAHTALNAPFAARVLLARLDAVPPARLKTGQSLGFSALRRFGLIDWPALRGSLPGLAAIIFLVTFTSFPVVLLLGGGPAVQTLEVAIYGAVRLDFDLPRAAQLGLVQVGLCLVIVVIGAALPPVAVVFERPATPTWRDRGVARALQWGVLAAALVLFAAPLFAIMPNALTAVLAGPPRASFWIATATSLVIAAVSAGLAVLLALTAAAARAATTRTAWRVVLGAPAYAYLAMPGVVLALGAFLVLRNTGVAPDRFALLVVIGANTLLALPFGLATLAPSFDAVARRRGRLIAALGLSGRRQFSRVEWPLMAREIGFVAALSFCFSLGDLGVIALFDNGEFVTLPLLMSRALATYRTADAALVAATMLTISVLAFTLLPPLFERLGRAEA